MAGDDPDDKSAVCIPFVLAMLAKHEESHPGRPLFVGLNGIQGAGKTTLVNALRSVLSKPPHSLNPVSFSIDDFYLPHGPLKALAVANPDNALLQQRGQPGTHDLPLLLEVFRALRQRQDDIRIPRYDKSAYHGHGDRADENVWDLVNRKDEGDSRKADVVLFEGWCAGFRALEEAALVEKWKLAGRAMEMEDSAGENVGSVAIEKRGRLGRQKLDDLMIINDALKRYDQITDDFDAFIHLDAEDTEWVYKWRLEAEAKLRASKGEGMSDQEVVQFVNGLLAEGEYLKFDLLSQLIRRIDYPAYELFSEKLRSSIFPGHKGKQLRIIVREDRKMRRSEIL